MTVGPMTAIGALVAEVRRAYMDETGTELSYGDIARRSRGPGERKGLTRGRVQQIAKDPVKQMPPAETIEQLARGLRVPASVVVERYMESLGIDHRRTSPATSNIAGLLATDPTLSPAAREHMVQQYAYMQRISALDGETPEYAREVDRDAIRASDLSRAQKAQALEAEEEARTSPGKSATESEKDHDECVEK